MAAIMAVAAQKLVAVNGGGDDHRSCSSWFMSLATAALEFRWLGAGRSVRDGPWATKPTPRVMRAMPAQRSQEMASWSQKRAEQGNDDVAEGGGGQNEGEVGPGERGEVAGEETDEQRDAEGDPWRENGGDEGGGMRERDGRQLRHATGEAGIAERSAERHQSQNQVLPRQELVLRHQLQCLAVRM